MDRVPDSTACSFCGKSYKEVLKTLAGPGVFICNECVDVCADIMDKELGRDARRSMPVQEIKERLELLRQLREGKKITEKEYRSRINQVVDRI